MPSLCWRTWRGVGFHASKRSSTSEPRPIFTLGRPQAGRHVRDLVEQSAVGRRQDQPAADDIDTDELAAQGVDDTDPGLSAYEQAAEVVPYGVPVEVAADEAV